MTIVAVESGSTSVVQLVNTDDTMIVGGMQGAPGQDGPQQFFVQSFSPSGSAAGPPLLWFETGQFTDTELVEPFVVYGTGSGGQGTGGAFIFTQNTPSTTWVIVHNLNRYPSMVVLDSAGTTVEPAITYDSLNQVTLTFSFAISGLAEAN